MVCDKFVCAHQFDAIKGISMSAFVGEAVVSGPKTDIAALTSAIAGEPDINFPSGDVRK